MVDDHILDDTRTLVLEGPDHLLQFSLCAPAGVMVEPEAWVIAHRLSLGVIVLGCLAALGHPDQVEVLRQFIGLLFQNSPF